MAAAKTKTARKKPAAKKSAASRSRTTKRRKLTEEKIEEITGYISRGATNKDAANKAHIAEKTFYRWINEGNAKLEKDPDCTDIECQLCQSLKEADTDRKLKLLSIIEQAGIEGKWQAAAWILERCYPDEFAVKSPMNVNAHLTGKTDEDPIKTESTVQIYLPDNGRNRKTEKK